MIKLSLTGLIVFFLRLGIKKKHRISYLITLEILILLILRGTLQIGLDVFFVLLMLAVGACEGAVGLRVMIKIARRNKLSDLLL